MHASWYLGLPTVGVSQISNGQCERRKVATAEDRVADEIGNRFPNGPVKRGQLRLILYIFSPPHHHACRAAEDYFMVVRPRVEMTFCQVDLWPDEADDGQDVRRADLRCSARDDGHGHVQ